MINNLEEKSKKELVEIVGIQIEEYQKLEKELNELKAMINGSEKMLYLKNQIEKTKE